MPLPLLATLRQRPGKPYRLTFLTTKHDAAHENHHFIYIFNDFGDKFGAILLDGFFRFSDTRNTKLNCFQLKSGV
jgi:hypothetical protein